MFNLKVELKRIITLPKKFKKIIKRIKMKLQKKLGLK
jgi:hypothetical protein